MKAAGLRLDFASFRMGLFLVWTEKKMLHCITHCSSWFWVSIVYIYVHQCPKAQIKNFVNLKHEEKISHRNFITFISIFSQCYYNRVRFFSSLSNQNPLFSFHRITGRNFFAIKRLYATIWLGKNAYPNGSSLSLFFLQEETHKWIVREIYVKSAFSYQALLWGNHSVL